MQGTFTMLKEMITYFRIQIWITLLKYNRHFLSFTVIPLTDKPTNSGKNLGGTDNYNSHSSNAKYTDEKMM